MIYGECKMLKLYLDNWQNLNFGGSFDYLIYLFTK